VIGCLLGLNGCVVLKFSNAELLREFHRLLMRISSISAIVVPITYAARHENGVADVRFRPADSRTLSPEAKATLVTHLTGAGC
jgi:hypothetical protein